MKKVKVDFLGNHFDVIVDNVKNVVPSDSGDFVVVRAEGADLWYPARNIREVSIMEQTDESDS